MESFLQTPPGQIIARHPALSKYAPWLLHLWNSANFDPNGRVPDFRCGLDECSQVQVKYSSEPLPIIDAYPIHVDSPRSSVTLLLEMVGVVEYRLRPSKDILHLLRNRLIAGDTLVVRIPAAAWGTGRFTKIDIFRALCDELVSATLNVEAPSNTLIYDMLGHLRQGLTMHFATGMNSSRVDQLVIHPGSYDQTRTLYIYDKSAPQGVVLSEQDPRCSRLGILVWDTNNKSVHASHAILINIQGAQQAPLKLDPAILQAIRQCLQQ